MSQPQPQIFYLHLLRFVAAIAVITIHVLGPFRELYGKIPMDEWFSAVGINAMSRWAVPVFIMISGALLLSSTRPLQCQHYLTRRLGKVVVPFIGWTLIYALISGYSAGQWDSSQSWQAIVQANNTPVWYHLWFFYDFIPLYFVIPLLAPILTKMTEEQVKMLLAAWFVLSLMQLLRVETPLRQNLILYSGYLVLGWYLFNRDNRPQLKLWLAFGLAAIAMNLLGSWTASHIKGSYSALYMGYKSLNTVMIGAMIFVLAQCYADRIGDKLKIMVCSISKYSLGIYLLHPILLIPVREWDNGFYDAFGHPLVAIPAISVATLLLCWGLTAALARLPVVNCLVP